MLDAMPVVRAEGTASGAHRLADGREVALTLTVRLETPGEACVAVASSIAFAYEPPLPDDVAVRLDDRLYDGLYDGLATVEGNLPPERLRVAVVALHAAPSLASALPPDDWAAVRALGDTLALLSVEALGMAWAALLTARR